MWWVLRVFQSRRVLSYADTLGVGCHSLIRVLLPALECMEIQLATIDAEHILMQHTQL